MSKAPAAPPVITVSAEGENTIVYSPGSNAKRKCRLIAITSHDHRRMRGIGTVFESPIATVIAAAQTAHDAGVTSVAQRLAILLDELPHELVEATDILLVNQHEVAQLLACRMMTWNHSTGMRSPNDSPITDSTGR